MSRWHKIKGVGENLEGEIPFEIGKNTRNFSENI
jgi:hypothetical protein